MRKTTLVLAATALFALATAAPAQNAMSFFITSKGPGKGAALGGLSGADQHCQALAKAAGAGGKTWRAYLSASASGGQPAVNARDRIGKGPWNNAAGLQIAASVDDLHSDKNKIDTEGGLAENNRRIPSRLFTPNRHDILTGSTADGRAHPPGKDMTCGNWTKSGEGSAFVGHHDRMGLRDDAPSKSWNASHPSRGCSVQALRGSGGEGLIYCFAAN